MPWKKDGNVFVPPLVINGIMWWHPSDAMLIAQGYERVEPPAPDTTAFDAACEQFREVCATIGAAIGKSDFKGGFDEYAEFIASDFAKENPAQASLYASMWSGVNEYAKYEGSKVGYGQPAWWYKCWESEASDES